MNRTWSPSDARMTLGTKTAAALKSEPLEVRFVPTVTTITLAYAAELAAANCAGYGEPW